jgi:hypothetical protein
MMRKNSVQRLCFVLLCNFIVGGESAKEMRQVEGALGEPAYKTLTVLCYSG